MVKRNSTERWKPVKDFEGRYEISDHGRVRSRARKWRTGVPRVLKQAPDRNGYQGVSLSRFHRQQTHSIHVLVLKEFIGRRPPGLVCDHIDANINNNHASNLRWITPSENVSRGNIPRGSRHYNAKLTEAAVILIRKRYAKGGVLQRELAAELGVGSRAVSKIILRKIWKHI